MKFGFGWLMVLCLCLAVAPDARAQDIGKNGDAPIYSIIATIIVRTPDPTKLAEYYEGLGFVRGREIPGQGVVFYLDGNRGSLEIIKMDPDTQPSGPKTSRTQQGVLGIFETDQLDEVVARAKALGSPVVDTWTHPRAGVSIHYIADPEYNFLGFTNRGHNPNINTP